MILLAVKMVADVTEIRNVIPSLEFKTLLWIHLFCGAPFIRLFDIVLMEFPSPLYGWGIAALQTMSVIKAIPG